MKATLYGKATGAIKGAQISTGKLCAILEFVPPFPVFTSLGVLSSSTDPKAFVAFESDGTIQCINVSDLKIP